MLLKPAGSWITIAVKENVFTFLVASVTAC